MRVKVHDMVARALVALDGVIKTAHRPDIVIEKSRKEEFETLRRTLPCSLARWRKCRRGSLPRLSSRNLNVSLTWPTARSQAPVYQYILEAFILGRRACRYNRQGAEFGASEIGSGKKVNVEFVSANPTGPLHVGHGRGAAVGDALARILEFAGYAVTREFYVNDRGRQVYTFGGVREAALEANT